MKFKSKYLTFLIVFAMTLTFSIVGVNNFKDNKVTKIAGTNTINMNASQQVKKKVSENLDVSWSPIGLVSNGIFKDLKINNPDLEIKKSAQTESQLDYVTDNSKITYTIEVKNNSDFDANQIEIKDKIPEDTIIVEDSISNNGILQDKNIKWIVDVKANQTITVSFSVKVIKQDEGMIKNTAIVDGKTTNEVINIFRHSAITATKAVSTEKNVTIGDEVEYTITLLNKGSIPGSANIIDPLNSNLEYVENSASNGGIFNNGNNQIEWKDIEVKAGEENKVNLTFKAKVKDLPENVFTGTIKNTAIVNNNKTNTVENTIVKDNIKATKTSNQAADSILKEGSEIEYTITLTNENGTMSKPVTITDKVPTGTTLVTGSINNNGIENNGTIIWKDIVIEPNTKIELKFKVTANDITSGVSTKIENTATITKDGKDENTNKVENTIGKPNLEFEKVSSKLNGTVKEGQDIIYTINVQNTGTLPKENIEITDTVPEGTTLKNKMSAVYTESTKTLVWNIEKLEANESTQVQFEVTVNTDLTEGYKIQNTGVVDGKNTNTTTNEVTYAKQQVQVIQTSETIKKKNIVMVIDLSSSMTRNAGDGKTKLEAAKTAAKDFISNIYKNGDIEGVNIQVLTFNNKSSTTGANYSGTKNLSFGNGITISKNKAQAELLKTAISNIFIPEKYQENGYGTHIYEALKLANTDIAALKSSYKDNDNVVVFLGDGEPTPSENDGFSGNTQTNISSEATSIKSKAKLYTIGFKMSDNGKALMKNISSGTGYAFTAENSQTLLDAFSGITKNASTTTKAVNSNSGYVEVKADGNIEFGKEYNITQNGVTSKYTSLTIEVNGLKTVYKNLAELVNSGILSYDSNTKTVRWNVKNYNEGSKLNMYFYID